MTKPTSSRRMTRERRTIEVMVRLFCRRTHGPRKLCSECRDLLDYALIRLDHCPFAGGEKPPCAKCPVHCYRPDMRERMKAVMRFSGPRMVFYHPVLAIMHLVDGRRRNQTGRG